MSFVAKFSVDEGTPLIRPASRDAALETSSSKLLGLELLRFVSALAVLFFHYNHFAEMAGMPPVARTSQPFYALLWPLYDYGQYGVQVFWGISGFIFFWKYGAAINAGAVAARQFFWLRFSRLYPLHVATLLFVVGTQAAYWQLTGTDFAFQADDAGKFALQLFMASDWGSPTPYTFNGPIWSISAEVAVYAAFFLALRQFSPSRSLCVAMIIASLALQIAGVDWNAVGCAAYFFAGGLAALTSVKTSRWAALFLGGLVTFAAIGGYLGDRDKLPTILLLAIPCLLMIVARDWPVRRWKGPIQFAGNLTYSSYLLNFPLQLILALGVAATGIVPPVTASWFLLAYLGITLTVAAASYRWFELPAQRWIRQRTLRRAA